MKKHNAREHAVRTSITCQSRMAWRSGLIVCLLLFALCCTAIEGYEQQYVNLNESENTFVEGKQTNQGIENNKQLHSASDTVEAHIEPMENYPINRPSTNPSSDTYTRSRLPNILAFNYRNKTAALGGHHPLSHGIVAYRVILTVTLGLGILAALLLLIKGAIKKMKQKKMKSELSMTFFDTQLSSQFLSDFSGNESSSVQTASFPIPTPKEKPTVIDILEATSPVPSQICLTSPMGKTKTSVWKMDEDSVQVDLSDKPQKILRKTSSSPSLTSVKQHRPVRDTSRRDAVLFYSDDEDSIANLKKKRKKKKWKKIIKQNPLKTS